MAVRKTALILILNQKIEKKQECRQYFEYQYLIPSALTLQLIRISKILGTYPEPTDKLSFVKAHQWDEDYENFVPVTYPWPGMRD